LFPAAPGFDPRAAPQIARAFDIGHSVNLGGGAWATPDRFADDGSTGRRALEKLAFIHKRANRKDFASRARIVRGG
jgi:hypothetical protein